METFEERKKREDKERKDKEKKKKLASNVAKCSKWGSRFLSCTAFGLLLAHLSFFSVPLPVVAIPSGLASIMCFLLSSGKPQTLQEIRDFFLAKMKDDPDGTQSVLETLTDIQNASNHAPSVISVSVPEQRSEPYEVEATYQAPIPSPNDDVVTARGTKLEKVKVFWNPKLQKPHFQHVQEQ